MNKFAVVAKKDEKSSLIERLVKKRLITDNWIMDKEHPQLIICVGGDGTLLYAVHKYIDRLESVCFVGIHTGTLGFFTDYTVAELDTFFLDILHHEPNIFCSYLLDIHVDEKHLYALNELRIENVKRTQEVKISVDGESFEKCRGSGICLSTQAGSTAYNRSLGGAVIDNGLNIMQLAEITAIQHRKQRSLGNPYILKMDRKVTLTSDDFSDALLCYDHLHQSLDGIKQIVATMSERCVRFARYREYSYLQRLKNLY